jgi:TrmH family RNA methyltransferase
MAHTITSLHNPAIKNLVKLRQRRARDRQRLLLIDGARALHLALRNAFRVETVYFAEPVPQAQTDLLRHAQAAGATLQPVTAAVFQKIGYGDNPDGVLGVAPQPPLGLSHLPCAPSPLYVITEGLEKPGNLGAILRSADAAGVTAVIICDSQTDIWNPNVIRASQGACFSVPMAVAQAQDIKHWLQQRRIRILATSPTAVRLYTQTDMCLPIALVLGAEHAGLTAVWPPETHVRIPMAGQIDSLNVAQTASIVLFEAVRQRSLRQRASPTAGEERRVGASVLTPKQDEREE